MLSSRIIAYLILLGVVCTSIPDKKSSQIKNTMLKTFKEVKDPIMATMALPPSALSTDQGIVLETCDLLKPLKEVIRDVSAERDVIVNPYCPRLGSVLVIHQVEAGIPSLAE